MTPLDIGTLRRNAIAEAINAGFGQNEIDEMLGRPDTQGYRVMAGNNLRRRPQDFGMLSPEQRKMYVEAFRAAQQPSAAMPENPEDVARQAQMSKMVMAGPSVTEFGEAQSIDSSDPANRETIELVRKNAAQRMKERYTPGSAFQDQMARSRAIQSQANEARRAKNTRLAFARGVLNPSAAAVAMQEGVLPNFPQIQADRQAQLLRAAQGHTGRTNPLQETLANALQNNPGLAPYILTQTPPPPEMLGKPGMPAPAAPATMQPRVTTQPNGAAVRRLPPQSPLRNWWDMILGGAGALGDAYNAGMQNTTGPAF